MYSLMAFGSPQKREDTPQVYPLFTYNVQRKTYNSITLLLSLPGLLPHSTG